MAGHTLTRGSTNASFVVTANAQYMFNYGWNGTAINMKLYVMKVGETNLYSANAAVNATISATTTTQTFEFLDTAMLNVNSTAIVSSTVNTAGSYVAYFTWSNNSWTNTFYSAVSIVGM